RASARVQRAAVHAGRQDALRHRTPRASVASGMSALQISLKSSRLGKVACLAATVFTLASCKMAEPSTWRTIFNGKSTEGWQMAGPGEVKLENGELVTYGGTGLFWYSREQFGDCRIRV